MARQRRVFLPGVTMHVLQRGAGGADMFHEDEDYEMFLDSLRQASEQNGTTVHVFTLMTNHVHLMVTADSASSLPRTMQQVGRWYVPYFNKRYGRVGTLCQSRYRAIPIETERYWLNCLRYVEQNPVRAGMVLAPGMYRWSSYHAHARGDWPNWLAPHAVYLSLGSTPGEREACYRAACGEPIVDPELSALRYAVHHGWVYGSGAFAAEIEAACGVRTNPRGARRARTTKLSLLTSGV